MNKGFDEQGVRGKRKSSQQKFKINKMKVEENYSNYNNL